MYNTLSTQGPPWHNPGCCHALIPPAWLWQRARHTAHAHWAAAGCSAHQSSPAAQLHLHTCWCGSYSHFPTCECSLQKTSRAAFVHPTRPQPHSFGHCFPPSCVHVDPAPTPLNSRTGVPLSPPSPTSETWFQVTGANHPPSLISAPVAPGCPRTHPRAVCATPGRHGGQAPARRPPAATAPSPAVTPPPPQYARWRSTSVW